jgi:aryl-alcohol dehydrogenase-like predicted oxidoreductase
LRPPSMEQPQYNMLVREKLEKEYLPLFRDLGYGTTTWSPLASGLLTGKYNNGIPEGSRLSMEKLGWLKDSVLKDEAIQKVKKLQAVADDLGVSMAQMGLAWCLKNPNVSTVITGASRVEQVHENMKAAEVVQQLTPEVMARLDKVLGNHPELDDD